MFDKISIPYESVMLFNIVKLKENVTIEDVEGLIGEMCFVVKSNYPGFRAGQVFKYSGFITFKELFSNLVEFCDESKELGYELLWQGEQEPENIYKASVGK